MKRTIELPPDLDIRIQDLAKQWKDYAGTSYDETVRTLLVLGLDALDRARTTIKDEAPRLVVSLKKTDDTDNLKLMSKQFGRVPKQANEKEGKK